MEEVGYWQRRRQSCHGSSLIILVYVGNFERSCALNGTLSLSPSGAAAALLLQQERQEERGTFCSKFRTAAERERENGFLGMVNRLIALIKLNSSLTKDKITTKSPYVIKSSILDG